MTTAIRGAPVFPPCVCRQHDMQQASTVSQSCEMTHAAQQLDQDVNSLSAGFKAPGRRTYIQHCNYRTQLEHGEAALLGSWTSNTRQACTRRPVL